jgi:small conductance mechanosensitive channel
MNWSATLDDLVQGGLDFIPRLIVALVIFGATLVLAGLAAKWVRRAAKAKIDDPETVQLLTVVARWTVLILGTLSALRQVNFDAVGFVAGLGLAGFTVGFALQDISRNFIAGLLLLIRQPFDVGDAVQVAGYSGTVLEISTRDTVIKTLDGEKVFLPNLEVFSNPITNYSQLPQRRRTVTIGLGYGEDVARASDVFLGAIRSVDGVLADPAPTLHAMELGDSALGLEAHFWLNQESHDLLDVH